MRAARSIGWRLIISPAPRHATGCICPGCCEPSQIPDRPPRRACSVHGRRGCRTCWAGKHY